MQRLPIDTDFPAHAADQLARLESHNKHHYRPNSYLHKWWARRCGSTFRYILKGLVSDPERRDYYTAGGLEGLVVLDPMMGGGTTLHEAIRLGANVIGADLDPIPVLQARATLSTIPIDELELAFHTLWTGLRETLGRLYSTLCPTCGRTTELKFTLYGVRRACRCGPAILVDSLVLRHETGGSDQSICPRCHAISTDGAACRCPHGAAELALIEKRNRLCRVCRAPYEDEKHTPFYARYEPLAIVASCAGHGLFFAPPTPADVAQARQPGGVRARFPRSEFSILAGPKSNDLLKRGIDNYLDLYTDRQLAYMDRATALLSQVEPRLKLNLALLISTSLEFNSMLCGYKGAGSPRPGAVRHTFAHHAYSFPYTALENNPLHPTKSSGTLLKLFHDRIRRARRWAAAPQERKLHDGRVKLVTIRDELDAGDEVDRAADLKQGERRFFLMQGSSVSLNLESDSVDAIVTDPPYFDSIQYSDLAGYFRVWLRRMLPEAAGWEVDIEKAAVDPHSSDGDHYARILNAIFSECHRVLDKKAGRLIFSFHHWNPRGWTALTSALKNADFGLLNHYIVHSENPASVHIANLKALTHDAILVLAPSESAARRDWPKPAAVDSSSSYHFCQDCASVLGWLLNTDFGEADFARLWIEFLDRA